MLNIFKKSNFNKGITPLLCALTVFNITLINAKALETRYCRFPFPEPAIPDVGGYFILNVYDTETGEFGSDLFYAGVVIRVDYEDMLYNGVDNLEGVLYTPPRVALSCIEKRMRVFYNKGSEYNTVVNAFLYKWNRATNSWQEYYRSQISGTDDVTFDIVTRDNYIIDNIYWKGNYTNVSWYEGMSGHYNYIISWGLDYEILQALQNLSGNLETIEDLEPVDSMPITNVNEKEENLIGNDIVNNEMKELNVEINEQSSNVLWGIIDQSVTSNNKVFTMFITILTFGIIAFVLRR